MVFPDFRACWKKFWGVVGCAPLGSCGIEEIGKGKAGGKESVGGVGQSPKWIER